jgi:putative membrane protein
MRASHLSMSEDSCVRSLLIRWAILGVAVFVAVLIVNGVNVHGGFWGYVLVAAVLGLVNAFIRPIALLLTLPINIITLGLFTIVVNALMLLIAAWLSTVLSIENFGTAILAALVISVVSLLLSRVVGERRR